MEYANCIKRILKRLTVLLSKALALLPLTTVLEPGRKPIVAVDGRNRDDKIYVRDSETPNHDAGTILPYFGVIENRRLIAEDELFVVFRDQFPVSPGHTLIVARRPVARFQQLTNPEQLRLLHWICWVQRSFDVSLTPTPDGFNLGLNDGVAAGQTIPQFHFHIIPRYNGDVQDPRGGVRHVISAKARYWINEPLQLKPGDS